MNKQPIIFFLGGAAVGGLITWIIEEARLRDLNAAWEDAYEEVMLDEDRYIQNDNVDYIYSDAEADSETKPTKGNEKKSHHRKAAEYHRYDRHFAPSEETVKEEGDILDKLAEAEHPLDDGEEPTDALNMTQEEIIEAVTDPAYLENEKLYERKEKARVKGPSLITYESYAEDFPEFDKDELYYYTVNEVIATEEDEVIDNELYVVSDCLDKFDFRHNAEDVIYIRNAGMGTDYMVHKVRGAFTPPDEDTTWG